MSFKLLTLLQLAQILVWYLLVTVGLPAWIFHKKLSGFSLSVRLLFYYVTGNAFAINLVYLLQLLHISNRVTLVLGTAAVAVFWGVKNNGLDPAAALRHLGRETGMVLRGGMGGRTLLLKLGKGIGRYAAKKFAAARQYLRGRTLDLLLAVGVIIFFFMRFGGNLFTTYSYASSDMIVHNYWINALEEGKLFVAGVYPYGFHCLMYYLHEIAGVDNYVLLRVFWIVQTLMVFLYGVFVFLKVCCKNRYLPYLGVAVYVYGTVGIFNTETFWRFFSSLPQNFGMIFILPAVLFLFLFFKKRKAELADGKSAAKDSNYCLAGFALCTALAISIHFYDAMIIALFCVAGIVSYGFRLFRKGYFVRVMAAGLLGILIAVLPMGIAALAGTPLEGSLHWGTNIIRDSLNGEEAELVRAMEEVPEDDTSLDSGSQNSLVETIEHELRTYVVRSKYSAFAMFALYVLPFVGLLFYLLRHRDYGARILTTGLTLWLHAIMLAANELGIPALMDGTRTSIYFALVLVVGAVLLADALLYGFTGWTRKAIVGNAIAISCLALVVGTAIASGGMSNPYRSLRFGTNEAVVCLTNIIHENKDKTWTILSANDENRMSYDHGYHYELTDFLQAMEYKGDGASVTIPTQYVYIFIEKIPQDYDPIPYEGSGQSVSEEGAAKALPEGNGLAPYQLENRWIIMSRMYYWAQAFQKLYPNELKVYFENDNFVCYCLEQNTYSLYNLAIDYGYNMR